MLQYLLFLILGLVGAATIIIVLFLLGLMVPRNWDYLCNANEEDYSTKILDITENGCKVIMGIIAFFVVIGGIMAFGKFIIQSIT